MKDLKRELKIYKGPGALIEAIERAIAAETENAELRKQLDLKESSFDTFFAKTEHLWQWARETLTGRIADQFWQIAANGYLMKENPEYHQRINSLRHQNKELQAEVERLKEELDELKRFYDKVCEGHYDEVAKLQSENAKLRKVVDIAWNVVETRGMSDVLLSELAGRLADWETWKEGER